MVYFHHRFLNMRYFGLHHTTILESSMASMETQKMMDLVTEKTGYGVSVIMASDIASWADMVSASEKIQDT